MDAAELEALVSGGESDEVEFKRSTGQRSDAMKTVCGMLSGSGGFVLFGVRNSGEIVGQDVGENTLERVVDELQKIEPHVPITPEPVVLESGRFVIALRAPGSRMGPFTYDGRPYIRAGPTSRVMPQETYRRLLLETMHPSQRWETQPSTLSIADLDQSEIARTVAEAVRRGRMEEPGTREPRELLQGFRLLSDQWRTAQCPYRSLRSRGPAPAFVPAVSPSNGPVPGNDDDRV